MRAWIFDYDRRDFEPYSDDKAVSELVGHTRYGEVILHLGDDGALSIIEDEQVRPWQVGYSLEVDFRVFSRDWFCPSVAGQQQMIAQPGIA
jgi:hypothetical protein